MGVKNFLIRGIQNGFIMCGRDKKYVHNLIGKPEGMESTWNT
jgi:hypothetical protein